MPHAQPCAPMALPQVHSVLERGVSRYANLPGPLRAVCGPPDERKRRGDAPRPRLACGGGAAAGLVGLRENDALRSRQQVDDCAIARRDEPDCGGKKQYG